MLRKELGETGSDQRYIMTVSGRGYRFAANVKQAPGSGHSTEELSKSSHVGDTRATAKKPGLRRWAIFTGVVIVLMAVLGAYFQWSRSRAQLYRCCPYKYCW